MKKKRKADVTLAYDSGAPTDRRVKYADICIQIYSVTLLFSLYLVTVTIPLILDSTVHLS